MLKHVVGFSGGCDSQAVALWVRQRQPAESIVLLYADPGGNDNHLTTEFIRWYGENVFPVTTVQPLVRDIGERTALGKREALGLQPDDVLTFGLMAELKGRFPSTKAQFCTEILKLKPSLRWMNDNCPDGCVRYVGVRRDESKRRSTVNDSEWDDYFDCELHRPIAAWTKDDVFRFLADAGELVNPLYRMGFGRVGCSPCINANKGDIREWAARFPEDVQRIRGWESSVGRTFFPPLMPGGAFGFVDDVIAWSRTARGGSQMELPLVEADVESGQCISKFGLCE